MAVFSFLEKRNNAGTTLAADVAIGEVTVTVAAAALLPLATPFLITVYHTLPTDATMEIMRVTNVAGNVLTVTRAQEGTAQAAHSSGDVAWNYPTAGTWEELEDAINTIADDYLRRDGTLDLTGDWTIATHNITLGTGTAEASQLIGSHATSALIAGVEAITHPVGYVAAFVTEAPAVATTIGINFHNSAGSSPILSCWRARGSKAIPAAVQNGDRLGAFVAAGDDGDGFNNDLASAAIIAAVDGAVGIDDIPTELRFEVGNNAAGRTAVMVLGSDGNITLDDATKLQWSDTNLYRSAANVLKTDDKFEAAGADFGDGTNQLLISGTGVLTLEGTAKRLLVLRPEVNVDEVKKQTVPVQVTQGVFFGYTMPIWNAVGNLHEELYFRQSVPGRWDGASDIIAHFLVCLSAIEDDGDFFKFELSWSHTNEGEELPAGTSADPTDEIEVVAGRTAAYDVYQLEFTIDYDADGEGNEIQPHDLLACRLRRVDATDPDVGNNIIVLDWHFAYRVNKMFKAL